MPHRTERTTLYQKECIIGETNEHSFLGFSKIPQD